MGIANHKHVHRDGNTFDWEYELFKGRPSAIGKLCRHSLEMRDAVGCKTALMVACETGKIEYIKALLKTGANVNQEIKGWTALFSACSLAKYDVAELLLDNGAIPTPITLISHIETVQPTDKLLEIFLHCGTYIPSDWDPLFVAIVLGRYSFLYRVGNIPTFEEALIQMCIVLTLRKTSGIDREGVLNLDFHDHVKESRTMWKYVAKCYGENSRWWLKALKNDTIAIRELMVCAMEYLFPMKLQDMCRMVILKALPGGRERRFAAIDKLDFPPPMLDYLRLRQSQARPRLTSFVIPGSALESTGNATQITQIQIH